MKFQKFFTLTVLSLALNGGLVADEEGVILVENETVSEKGTSVHYGATSINNETIEDLTIFGPAFINNSKITKLATIKGPIEAKHSSFNNIIIHGVANFDDVQVNKEIFINGPLFAVNSTFEEISIASDDLSLSNSQVAKLFVRKNDNPKKLQKVFLENGTKIDSIVFESRTGQVIRSDASVIVTNLEGGEIMLKDTTSR